MGNTCLTAVDDRWFWADRGNCVGRPELFYHGEDDLKGLRRLNEEMAKRICDECVVIADCRRHALDHGELYGVWGGLTENERHRLAQRQRTG